MNTNGSRLDLGCDLLLVPTYAARDADALDLTTSPTQRVYLDETVDLAIAAGRDCLRQALVLRLLTPKGALTSLGHAGYGSRLHELVGEPNTAQNRLRARAFVLEALRDEARIEEVVQLEVVPDRALPERITIGLSVRPVAEGDAPPLTFAVEVDL